jgi:hypothetical protein
LLRLCYGLRPDATDFRCNLLSRRSIASGISSNKRLLKSCKIGH